MPFDVDTTERHDSFGMVGFNRVSSSHDQNFFGSSVRCNHYIEMHVKRATRRRDLNNYWYHGEKELIKIRLSPNQFAELLTTMNIGDGVPCTLQYVGREKMPDCPSVDQRALFESEFAKDVADSVSDAEALFKEIKAMFAGKASIGQRDRAEILKKLDLMVSHIKNGMPFVQAQFNEAMDKTVVEAKSEVEAFINNKIHSLGVAALNEDIAAALAAPLSSEPLQLPAGVEPQEQMR
jgi:hypothetical protein